MIRLVLLATALASGGGAALLVGSAVSDNGRALASADASQPVPTTEILLASVDIAEGGEIAPDALRWQTWPSDVPAVGMIRRSDRADAIEELTGSVMRSKVVAGTPIFADAIAPPKSSYLSAVLKPGMRAVGIRVSAEKTAGGFILPNNRVDVLLAMPCQPHEGCDLPFTVKTILKNVRVLAIDQSNGDASADGVLLGKTATLELDPEQTERIIGAEAAGTLSLVLRPANDLPGEPEKVDRDRTVRINRAGEVEYVPLR